MSLLDSIEGAHQKLLRPSGGCHNCPRKLVDFVPATLPTVKILWLGEAPGAVEVEEGRGFVGRAGELLRRDAGAAGLDVEAVSNIIHCRPPKNATPKPKEISCCLSQFGLDEIRGYPIVVLCGSVPLAALFPKARANRYRGNVAHHPDFPGQRFYAIYHPAYILRRPDLEDRFHQQLKRLYRIVQGEPPLSWQVVQGAGAYEALKTVLTAPLISFDTETTRLESWDPQARLRSFAVTSDAKTAIVVHEDEPHWISCLQQVRAYLEQPEKGVVGNHIGFDLDWMEHELEFQVRCTGVHELGAIYYQARQYRMPSLKELVSTELDGYRYLVYDPAKERDLTLLGRYNAEDVIYGLQLFFKGIRLLKPKTRDLVTRVLGPASLCLRQISSAGFYLRQNYRQQKIEEYQDRRRQVIAAWREADPEFIPVEHESGKGLSRYLFEIRKLPIVERTPKGEASTDQSAVKQWILGGASYLQHLIEMREIDKIQSTYLTAYDKHLGPEGRIHSDYTLTLLPTGRSSSRKPNLQNIPRLAEIRDLFGVPLGGVLIEGDLNQIEFRIMMCLAKDETGIAAYLRGGDVHTSTAKAFAPHPTKEQRSRAKPINFALLYGGDWYNVQNVARNDYGLDWSQEQCTDFTQIFFSTYKSLPGFHQFCRDRLVQNRGWFESVLGHVFYYRGWDNPDKAEQGHIFRAALNSEAQGPAAQILFAVMVQSRRLLQERKLANTPFVNTVHDSLLIEAPTPDMVAPIIQCMDEAVALVYEWVKPWFVVPLIMDYKTGESWGSLEEYKIGGNGA